MSAAENHSTPKRRDAECLVVVGGKEFVENIHHLRSISDYFEGAISSGMKESRELRFEFPDRDPEEWELIKKIFNPFASTRISWENWGVALSWFDELCIVAGLESAGENDHFHACGLGKVERHVEVVSAALEHFGIAQRCGLEDSCIRLVLRFSPPYLEKFHLCYQQTTGRHFVCFLSPTKKSAMIFGIFFWLM